MQTVTLSKKSVPTGIINDIKYKINLAADIGTELYQNDDIDYYGPYVPIIPEEAEKVNIVISYDLEDSLVNGFSNYLDNYIESIMENYCDLNKSWRLDYDKCK